MSNTVQTAATNIESMLLKKAATVPDSITLASSRVECSRSLAVWPAPRLSTICCLATFATMGRIVAQGSITTAIQAMTQAMPRNHILAGRGGTRPASRLQIDGVIASKQCVGKVFFAHDESRFLIGVGSSFARRASLA